MNTETSLTLKDLGKIILYLVATVVLGALLAPPLLWGAQWLAAHGILTWLPHVEFRRFFHRAILVAAIALIWPVACWLRVSGVRGLGLERNSRRFGDVAAGFALSFLLMVVLAEVLVAKHVVEWSRHIPWGKLETIAISAVVVSFLEEWLFRGAILGLLIRALPEWAALTASSALFSIVHFLKSQGPPPAIGKIGWFSGFALIPDAFSRFSQPMLVLGGFTTLFCIGWILGWARLKTRSLAMSMGLHAGWILGVMSFAKVTRRVMKNTMPWFGEDLSVGLGAVAVVLATGLLVWAWVRYIRGSGGGGGGSRPVET